MIRPEENKDSFSSEVQLEAYAQKMMEAAKTRDPHKLYEEAKRWEKKYPNSPNILNLLGILAYYSDKPGEAEKYFRRVIAVVPHDAYAVTNFSYSLLSLGKFDEGWFYYQKRLNLPNRTFSLPSHHEWQGEEVEELLVIPEQGYGDSIQFLRFCPFLRQKAKKIIFACPKDFIKLAHHYKPLEGPVFDQILDGEAGFFSPKSLPYVPLCSLPYFYKMTLMNLPRDVPYLYGSADPINQWQSVVEDYCKKANKTSVNALRVGIVWSGRPEHPNDANRSLDAKLLGPLAHIPGVVWFSLQKNKHTSLPSDFPILDVTDHLTDLVDTMGLIHHLDLVITVDTALCHLAGAMGKPTWLLLPYAPEWRWLHQNHDSPWYPTMQLFRQSKPHDWRTVIGRVAQALQDVQTAPFKGSDAPPAAGDHPSHQALWLGKKLILEGKYPQAEKLLMQALRLRPNLCNAYNLLGIAQGRQNKLQAGLNSFEKALVLDPGFSNARLNAGMILLKAGHFGKGFDYYESRRKVVPLPYTPPVGIRWEGQPLDNKNLFVVPEQGFGDTIQMSRFIPLLKEKTHAKSVHVIVRPPLVRLFQSLKNIDSVTAWSDQLPLKEDDFYVSIMSLPYHLTIDTLEKIPNQGPYLGPFPSLNKRSQPLFNSPDSASILKIGLVWHASSEGDLPSFRTCALEHLEPLFYIPNTQWVALHPDHYETMSHTPLKLLTPPLDDFADTASVIESLDLVISVDTSVAHLAGALGKPVWVMLDYNTADWRWLLHGRKDSPWYPSMQLFHQPKSGDWPSVVQAVYQALMQLIKAP